MGTVGGRKKRFIAGLLTVCLVFSLLFGFSQPALAKTQGKTVKVAASAGPFITVDKDNHPVSGYAYEYIETLAAYSGWNVEYVMCSNFSESLSKVTSGEVDMFYDVSRSAEREQILFFPNTPMGSEDYYLYCLPSNKGINAMDYVSYSGKRVGVTSNTVQTDMLKKWCEEKVISLEFIEFKSRADKEAALEAGEIDLDLEVSMLANKDFSALDKIAGSDYYLVVNKDRPDILSDINNACTKISSIDKNFFTHLDEKYFSHSLVSKALTKEEANWANSHKVLTIGYMNDYLPFSATDKKGSVSGIIKDIVPLMFENIGLKGSFELEYVGFNNNDDMYAALNDETIDCIFPVCGNMSFAIEKNALFSSSVMAISVDMAYNNEFSTDVIAVNRNNQLQNYYTNTYYPNAEIVYCDSIEECLRAVASKKASSTILNGLRTHQLLQNSGFSDLDTASLPNNVEFCFAVKSGNSALLSLINRALANTDDSAAVTFSYQVSSAENDKQTVLEYLSSHPEYLVTIAFIIAIVIVALILHSKRKARLSEEAEIERLIESVASTYFISYTVNMENDSCEVLKYNENLPKEMQTHETFTHLKETYITHLPKFEINRFKYEFDYETLRNKLKENKTFVAEYQYIYINKKIWMEITVTAIDENKFAIGFADKDLEIIRRHIEVKRYDEYFALYVIDLDIESIKIVKNNEHYQDVPIGNTVPYTPYIQKLAEKLEEEPRKFYMRISDIEYLKKEFATDDKRTFSYRSSLVAEGKLWIEVTAYVILRHDDGTPALVSLGFSLNDAVTSSRQEIQSQLKEAYRQVEEANKSKTSFLFNMSHDIRTPMNAITGFTGMAKKYINDSEKVMDYLNKIDTSGQQLLTLINQVLEMSRIESGKAEIDRHPVCITDEYHSLITVLAEQAKDNGLEFHHSIHDIRHQHVFSDTAKMNSITLNITGNAMKYTPKGGRIDFIFKEVQSRKPGFATYVFTVQDTGIGMSKEYLEHLFDPFTREKNTTVSKSQGTGLGMSIVKELVNMLGGTIDVESEPGKGTRFDITVDFEINENADTSNDIIPLGNDVSLEGKRVLVVEDNELNREIILDILQEKGLEVESAEDGTVSVELLTERGPDYFDFILMDIQMPIMGGYEATKVIRDMYPDKHITIIALSANAFAEDKASSLNAGMDAHIAKPIDTKELFETMMKFV